MPENSTPDTTAYLVLGLVVAFGIFCAFIASIVIRYRNLQKDAQVLEHLDENH